MVLNGGGGYTESKGRNETETTYHNIVLPEIPPGLATQPNDISSYQSQNSNNKTYNNNYNATGGFVYDISDKTSLSLSGVVRTFEGDNREPLNTYNEFYRANRSTLNWDFMNSLGTRTSVGRSNNLAFQGI